MHFTYYFFLVSGSDQMDHLPNKPQAFLVYHLMITCINGMLLNGQKPRMSDLMTPDYHWYQPSRPNPPKDKPDRNSRYVKVHWNKRKRHLHEQRGTKKLTQVPYHVHNNNRAKKARNSRNHYHHKKYGRHDSKMSRTRTASQVHAAPEDSLGSEAFFTPPVHFGCLGLDNFFGRRRRRRRSPSPLFFGLIGPDYGYPKEDDKESLCQLL